MSGPTPRRLAPIVALGLAAVLSLVWVSTGWAPDLPAVGPLQPSPTATAAPTPRPPRAPSVVGEDRLASGSYVIRWGDNSDDEDGFRIRVEFPYLGEVHDFTAPANATVYVLPEGVRFGFRTWEECRTRSHYKIAVWAYNAAGESGSQMVAVDGCGPPPTPGK